MPRRTPRRLRDPPPRGQTAAMLFSEDTSPEARAVLIQSYRAMSPERRLAIALDASDAMRAMVRADIATRHPEATEEERQVLFLQRCFGDAVAEVIVRWRRSGGGPPA